MTTVVLLGISALDVTAQGIVSADPAVSSLDELDAEPSILLVGVAIPWHRWSIEVIERHEEPDCGAVVRNQVLQHEEVDVPPEVLEQREKVAVPRQRFTEWAEQGEVVPADALERVRLSRSQAGSDRFGKFSTLLNFSTAYKSHVLHRHDRIHMVLPNHRIVIGLHSLDWSR